MLLSIDIFLIVCVCVIVLITRDFIYNKSDSFFRRYIGILYIIGVLIQINIGFVVNHLDINHHYFYLFPVEVFFLIFFYIVYLNVFFCILLFFLFFLYYLFFLYFFFFFFF